jgi:rhodanese-related sulfurtransferase
MIVATSKSPKVKGTTKKQASCDVRAQIPKGKETVLGLYVTAREAYDMWKAGPDKVKIIDCRTNEEFLFVGHPPMAWNIPVALQIYKWDADKRQFPMIPNPDFVVEVKKVVNPGDTLLVTCRSGGRACLAINALGKAGFKKVYNIIDGMEGDTVTDPNSVFLGQKMKNGWKNSGLPWTYDVVPERIVLPKIRS